jgi:hypothetical protein
MNFSLLSVTAFADDNSATATPSNVSVYVDGAQEDFTVYNINGSSFIKLRDFAKALSSTSKRFDLSYETGGISYSGGSAGTVSTADLAITLKDGYYYTSQGNELQGNSSSDSAVAKPIDVQIHDGLTTVNMPAYSINDSSYFSLRYIAYIFGFGLNYSSANNQINLDMSSSYELQSTDTSVLCDKWYPYSEYLINGSDTWDNTSFYSDGTLIDVYHGKSFNSTYQVDGDTIIEKDSYSNYNDYTFCPYEIYAANGNTYLDYGFGSYVTICYIKQP